MRKVYIKQAIHMLKKDRLISIISITGTALAITMIMIIFMMREVTTGNVPPEVNRNRSLYINLQDWVTYNSNGEQIGQSRGYLKYTSVKECLLPLQTPEYVSVKLDDNVVVNREGDKNRNSCKLSAVDSDFWKIFSFSFVDGKPFSDADFESGIKTAVINEDIARQVFQGENAVGKTIEINFMPYKVTGVVKNVSVLNKYAYSEVWIPYKSLDSYQDGSYNCVILAKSPSDFEAITEEVLANQSKYNSTFPNNELFMNGPYNIENIQLRIYSSRQAEGVIKAEKRKTILIFCIVLLIPAINLSSFSLSKIKNRMSEIGVRKAFGATKFNLISQVLYENMIATLIGGIIGLVLSAIAVFSLKNILLGSYETVFTNGELTVSFSSLFSPVIFINVFAACLVLNILSASIPAYRTSRLPIVNALKS